MTAPTSCPHLDIGCCDDCRTSWLAARAAMESHQRALTGPGRPIPYSREFPDSDAWQDEDGVIHYGDENP